MAEKPAPRVKAPRDSWARLVDRFCIDAARRVAMQAILDKHPKLCTNGFNVPRYHMMTVEQRQEMFAGFRLRMTDASSLDQFVKARRWLRRFPKLSRVNRQGTSYGLKHRVERDVGRYVSNGALIAAAIAEGFRVERIEGTPNAQIGIGVCAWREPPQKKAA